MQFSKLRYSPREAQNLIGLKNTAFWARVKDGRMRVQRDGSRTFVTADELQRYVGACEAERATEAQ